MNTHHSIHWISADRQGDIDMSGEYAATDRHAAIEEACRELLDQCGDDDQRAGILAGSVDGEPVHGWLDAGATP